MLLKEIMKWNTHQSVMENNLWTGKDYSSREHYIGTSSRDSVGTVNLFPSEEVFHCVTPLKTNSAHYFLVLFLKKQNHICRDKPQQSINYKIWREKSTLTEEMYSDVLSCQHLNVPQHTVGVKTELQTLCKTKDRRS